MTRMTRTRGPVLHLHWLQLVLIGVALVLGCLGFAALRADPAAAAAGGVRVDTEQGKGVNVRPDPSTEQPALYGLADGTALDAVARVRGEGGQVWVQLADGGFVSADLVAGDPALPLREARLEPAAQPAPKPSAKPAQEVSGQVNAPDRPVEPTETAAGGVRVDTEQGKGVNVRPDPSTEQPALYGLADGTALDAVARVRGEGGQVWVQLADGGFVSADLVAGDPALPLREARLEPELALESEPAQGVAGQTSDLGRAYPTLNDWGLPSPEAFCATWPRFCEVDPPHEDKAGELVPSTYCAGHPQEDIPGRREECAQAFAEAGSFQGTPPSWFDRGFFWAFEHSGVLEGIECVSNISVSWACADTLASGAGPLGKVQKFRTLTQAAETAGDASDSRKALRPVGKATAGNGRLAREADKLARQGDHIVKELERLRDKLRPYQSREGRYRVKVGADGETRVREFNDIGAKSHFTGAKGAKRIADGENDLIVTEIKNVKTQGLTRQIRDYVEYAKAQEKEFDLWVNVDTRISEPLWRAADRHEVNLRYIP